MSLNDHTQFLLDRIENPGDLRKLDPAQLTQVAQELREFLTQSFPGRDEHLTAGLGAVELAVALHYVFDTPRERIVWDAGHQTYPHKVLTGRRASLHTI